MKLDELIYKLVECKTQKTYHLARAKEIESDIAKLEGDIMKTLAAAGTVKAATQEGHSVTMSIKEHPTITNWSEFYEHVAMTNDFDLLQKRLSSTAFRERWNKNEVIPGTSTIQIPELSLHTARN